MIIMLQRIAIGIVLMGCFAIIACKKSGGPAIIKVDPRLDYGDSIFYLNNNSSSDYIITPAQSGNGKYQGYPEGIVIDANTGAINISKSETGLRYLISFTPAGGTDSITTKIVISGINFLDGFYVLTGNDSIAQPVYNARLSNILPGINNGSVFDIGSNCNSNGCAVSTVNAQINLASTVRSGVFGSIPANNARQEFQLNYRINDNSLNAANTIRVKLYYFNTMADVSQEAFDIISQRIGSVIGLGAHNVPLIIPGQNLVKRLPRPRPPCIFIVGR